MAAFSPFQETLILLRNGNPQAFDQVLVHLGKLLDTAMGTMATATPADILVTQGRVQAYTNVLRIFNESTIDRSPKPSPASPASATGVNHGPPTR